MKSLIYVFVVSQDDCRVVLAKQEINCLLETLQKQQHQFTEIADHIQLDAGIPVTFTKVPFQDTLGQFDAQLKDSGFERRCSRSLHTKVFTF